MLDEPVTPRLLLSFLVDPHEQLSAGTRGQLHRGVYHTVRKMTMFYPIDSAVVGRMYTVIKSFKPQYISHAGFWEIDDNR